MLKPVEIILLFIAAVLLGFLIGVLVRSAVIRSVCNESGEFVNNSVTYICKQKESQ